MISSFIFDLDGTLFDSSEANVAAYSQAFKAAGVEFNENKYRQLFGLRFSEMIDAIAPGTNDEVKAKIKTAKAESYKANLALVKPNNGLIKLLEAVSPGFSTALVTTASKTNVTNLLKHFNIAEDLFKVIITGEDVTNGKPDPECYLKTIEALAVKPEDCCVFEDSPVGIEAARKAGIEVIKIAL